MRSNLQHETLKYGSKVGGDWQWMPLRIEFLHHPGLIEPHVARCSHQIPYFCVQDVYQLLIQLGQGQQAAEMLER